MAPMSEWERVKWHHDLGYGRDRLESEGPMHAWKSERNDTMWGEKPKASPLVKKNAEARAYLLGLVTGVAGLMLFLIVALTVMHVKAVLVPR